jgi:hypothetical protein
VAVRFHIDGHVRSVDEGDALVLVHFLRTARQAGLAEAIRAAATTLPAETPLRIDRVEDVRAILAAVEACRELISTPELEQLRVAAEAFVARC